MKNLKKLIVATVMVAFGAVAAYAVCEATVLVVSGNNVYQCKNTGTLNGTCTYGNCEIVGRRKPVSE